MASWEDIRAIALALPGVEDDGWKGDPGLKVGTRTLVQTLRGRVLMKLDRNHQELLFEARPEVFSPYVAGALRWSWVEIEALDADEATDLVREAWRQIVPKTVSRAYDSLSPPVAATPAPPPERRRPGARPTAQTPG